MILFFVGFIIYALMRCLPTSFIENMARQKSMQPGSKSFDDWMAQLNAMYNMDKSVIPGYFSWLGTAIRGDFGDSWFYTVPVLEKFNDCIWLSFVMGGIAFILEILIAVPLGVIAATKQYMFSEPSQILTMKHGNGATTRITDIIKRLIVFRINGILSAV